MEMESGDNMDDNAPVTRRSVTYSISFCNSILPPVYVTDTQPLLDDDTDDSESVTYEDQDRLSAIRDDTCNKCGLLRRTRSKSEGANFDDSYEIRATTSIPHGLSKPEMIPGGGRRKKQNVAASLPNFNSAGGITNLEPYYGNMAGNGSAHRVVFCVHGNVYGDAGCCTELSLDTARGKDDLESGKSDSGEHCHPHRLNEVDKRAQRKLIFASILCVTFMIGEVVGGVLSNSLAIATDAAHLLTDFASFMISLFSLWIATRPSTKRMSFGWYRAEVIGAMTSVLLIWVVTGILVYMAIQRIINETYEVDADIMLITSAVGVAVNIVMGCTLHQHGHSHGGGAGHGHSHESGDHGHSHAELNGNETEVEKAAKKKQNINVRAAFIHVVGDFIQSLGVFIAALIIYFKPEFGIVDPICTFMFSVLVLITTFAIMRDTLTVLMEGLPKGIDFMDVQNTFLQIDGVVKVHNLRIWALSMDKTALAAHLAIKAGVSTQTILTEASKNIRSKYDFFEMTLQIEDFQNEMEECTQCQCPKD